MAYEGDLSGVRRGQISTSKRQNQNFLLQRKAFTEQFSKPDFKIHHTERAGATVTTAARPTAEASCHWYFPDGKACYEVPRSDGQGMRPTTLRDARVLGLLPSVTTILNVLRKPQLESWLVEQAVLAAMTTPRLDDEPLDAFVERVLHTEKVQDQESDIAKKRGTEIHAACEAVINGQGVDGETLPWILPALTALQGVCAKPVATEQILVGNGYAGKCDLIAHDEQGWEWIIDFKTTKKLPPKESWWEHQMQTAAYLKCRPNGKRHANVYISTVNQGEFVIHDNGDYALPYAAFEHLVGYWRTANRYYP